MKEIFFNTDNLIKEQIDEEVIRVKALIINSKGEILLGYSHNVYQFPGGHLDEGESLNNCLKREIKEETGMDISLEDLEPFMLIKYYSKNYFNRGKNRCNKIYYFIVNTDKEINLYETNYTKEEKEGNYELRYIKLNNLEDTLIDNCNKYIKSRTITYEMLQVINEFNSSIKK